MKNNFFMRFFICIMAISTILALPSCTSKTVLSKGANIDLYISAASSLTNVMSDIKRQYEISNPQVNLIVSYGGSGTLSQQIIQGAPSDVFISAGKKQMQALADKSLLLSGTDKNLLTNNIVLIAPSGSSITAFSDLALPKVKSIALGDTSIVPAGQYGAQVLDYLHLTATVQPKIVYGQDVETVLSWVATGNADAGLVYKTDAISSGKVKIIADAPAASHDPVIYPVSVISASKNPTAAVAFEHYLYSKNATALFAKYGFGAANGQ